MRPPGIASSGVSVPVHAMRYLPALSSRGLLAAGVLLAVLSTLQAENVVIPASADTSIFSVNPGNNLGGLSDVPLGPINRDANAQGFFEQGRMLVRFDLAGRLPAGAQVTGASLRLTVVKERSSGAALTVDAHRLLVPWGEGVGDGSSSGTTANPGEASWTHRLNGQALWAQAGAGQPADRVTARSGTTVVDNAGSYTFASTPELISDIQSWLADPAANQGWILLPRSPMAKGSAKRIVTRESASGAPTLTLTYTVPPPPELRLDSIRLAEGKLELRFRGEPGNIYEVQSADRPEATVWQPLTNYIVKLLPIDALATDVPDQVVRFYRVAITGHVD